MKKINYFILLILCSLNSFSAVTILNGLSHNYSVTAGENYTGQIIVGNTDESPRLVSLSLFDYSTNAKGESNFAKPGTNARSNVNWIVLNESMVRINPDETYSITYEIRVPDNVESNGTYWSVIMVEPSEEPDTAAIKKGQIKIQNKIRYAVQIICQVGESGKIEVKFTGVEVVKENDQRFIYVDIENTGQRYVRPVIQLDFFDTEGREAGMFESIDQGVYPGSSVKYKIEITALPTGDYKVVALAKCSSDNTFGINLSLKIKDD